MCWTVCWWQNQENRPAEPEMPSTWILKTSRRSRPVFQCLPLCTLLCREKETWSRCGGTGAGVRGQKGILQANARKQDINWESAGSGHVELILYAAWGWDNRTNHLNLDRIRWGPQQGLSTLSFTLRGRGLGVCFSIDCLVWPRPWAPSYWRKWFCNLN